jgi:hypothetical protein
MKRRGADYVAQLTGKMTQEEQLTFWQQRTDALRQRQAAKQKRTSSTH